MKAGFKVLLGLAIVALVAVVANAEEKEAKEVTLKGTLGCAKCVFKVKGCKVCTNAIKVKEGDKEVIYVIDDGGKKAKYHGKICTSSAEGSVKGTITAKPSEEKPGKIKPSKDGVKFD
jgi:hypothetical protein